MQETVTNSNERKSLFSTYLEVLDSKEKQAQLERQAQEEKFLRRTQKIYDYHDRQVREAVELRRCVDYVSQHAMVLESVLRGAANDGGVPLSGTLVRQAAALQRCMAQCVANAAQIKQLVSASHREQMDAVLSKMERELTAWTAFLQKAVTAVRDSETVVDNLHNMIAEQRRCVRDVTSSTVFRSLCESPATPAADPASPSHSAAAACSTPISRD